MQPPKTLCSACLTLALLLSGAAQATQIVTSRTALGANDLLLWSGVGTLFDPADPTSPAPFLTSPFSLQSDGGLTVEVSIPPAPVLPGPPITPPFVFQTLTDSTPTNFAPGDYILFSGLRPGRPPAPGNPGPITIRFATPVMAAGLQLAVDDSLVEYQVFLSVYDVSGSLLDSFAIGGTSSTELDNSAVFLGVSSDRADIGSLVYRSSLAGLGIGVNQLSLRLGAVPEPAGLFLAGLLVLTARRRSGRLRRETAPG